MVLKKSECIFINQIDIKKEKIMKIKFLSVILSLSILFGLTMITASAESTLDIRYDVHKTDTQVIVSCYADSNPGIEGGILYLPYNSSAVTYVSAKIPTESFMTGKMTQLPNSSGSCVYINYDSVDILVNTTGTGIFAIITFDIKDDSLDEGFTTDTVKMAAAATTEDVPLTSKTIQESWCDKNVKTVPYTLSITYNLNVTLTDGTGYSLSGEPSVIRGNDYTFSCDILSGYYKTSDFAIYANGTKLTGSSGKYTISNVQTDQIITVSGVEKIIPGDMNLDRKVNSKDVLMMRKALSGIMTPSTDQITAADVYETSSSGIINSKDLLYLRKMLVKLV